MEEDGCRETGGPCPQLGMKVNISGRKRRLKAEREKNAAVLLALTRGTKT